MSTPDVPPAPPAPPAQPERAYLKTEFLDRLAHELRGPAGVTSGALDEIELAVGPEADKLRTYFLMARRGMQRILRIAERLERTAQLERGEIAWAKAPTDLRALAEQAAQQAELLEARRSVRVSVSQADEACPVAADPKWMVAAIAEVVGNAIRFARSLVSVHTGASADEVRVTIADDGPGFTGPAAPRFEPPAGKRGVGLSLPLVCEVLASHGGRIEIDGVRTAVANGLSGAHVVLVLPRLKASAT